MLDQFLYSRGVSYFCVIMLIGLRLLQGATSLQQDLVGALPSKITRRGGAGDEHWRLRHALASNAQWAHGSFPVLAGGGVQWALNNGGGASLASCPCKPLRNGNTCIPHSIVMQCQCMGMDGFRGWQESGIENLFKRECFG